MRGLPPWPRPYPTDSPLRNSPNRNRSRARERRRLRELQAFIDTANAPIFGVDAAGRVNEWNRKAAAITGFDRPDALGRDLVQARVSLFLIYKGRF